MRYRKFLFWCGVLICTAGFIICSLMFFLQWREYRAGEQSYEALEKTVISVSPKESPGGSLPAAAGDGADTGTDAQESIPDVDFDAMYRINPDTAGWLYSPDTVISYPVVQGNDNVYYLKHLFDGTQNSAGCLFLDSRCSGTEGRNSIIYGHHMKNGTLFAALDGYREQSYYDTHPRMFFITPDKTLVIELFSAYVAGQDSEAWQLEFSSDEEYAGWLERISDSSMFESEVIPDISDKVITLSTCNYSYQGARLVCHGIIKEA